MKDIVIKQNLKSIYIEIMIGIIGIAVVKLPITKDYFADIKFLGISFPTTVLALGAVLIATSIIQIIKTDLSQEIIITEKTIQVGDKVYDLDAVKVRSSSLFLKMFVFDTGIRKDIYYFSLDRKDFYTLMENTK